MQSTAALKLERICSCSEGTILMFSVHGEQLSTIELPPVCLCLQCASALMIAVSQACKRDHIADCIIWVRSVATARGRAPYLLLCVAGFWSGCAHGWQERVVRGQRL